MPIEPFSVALMKLRSRADKWIMSHNNIVLWIIHTWTREDACEVSSTTTALNPEIREAYTPRHIRRFSAYNPFFFYYYCYNYLAGTIVQTIANKKKKSDRIIILYTCVGPVRNRFWKRKNGTIYTEGFTKHVTPLSSIDCVHISFKFLLLRRLS